MGVGWIAHSGHPNRAEKEKLARKSKWKLKKRSGGEKIWQVSKCLCHYVTQGGTASDLL